jgi:hypothetical protein
MASGAIELKIIFSAAGAGGVASAIGSMTGRMEALTQASAKTSERMSAMGVSVIDAFAKEKQAVVAASKALEAHRAETTRMGKSLAEAKQFQAEATQALKAFNQTLASQDTKTTDAQRLKLKLLREQAKGAENDVKALTREFDKQREHSKELNAALIEQTRKVQGLREEMKKAGVNTAALGIERSRLRRMMEQEQRTLDKLTARYERLVAVQKDVAKYKGEFNDRRMNAVAAVGVGATLAVPVVKSAQFEDRIRQISITGELYNEKGAEAALAGKVREAAVRNGISHDSVASGVDRLVAQGMNANVAGNYAGILAKSAKATRADMGDLAELIYTLQTKFKLETEGEIFEAINVLAKAGKLGQYEIKAMAKAFPELGGAAASFGSKGLQGVKEMGALMQVMRAGAGSNGEAETYMRNWFSHLSANSTQEHFKGVGINFEKAKLEKVIAAKGKVSNVEASFMVFDDYLDKVVKSGQVKVYDKKGKLKSSTDMRAELRTAMEQAKKDGLQGEALNNYIQSAVRRVGLSSVLQDIQATQAYLAWLTGKEKYKDTRTELDKDSVKNTIDRDYAEQNRLTTAQWENLKVQMTELGIVVGNILSPAVGNLLGGLSGVAEYFQGLAKDHPEITSALVIATASIAAFTAALLALGVAASVVRLGLAGARGIPIVGGLFGSPKTAGAASVTATVAKDIAKPPVVPPPSAGGWFSRLSQRSKEALSGLRGAMPSVGRGWFSDLSQRGKATLSGLRGVSLPANVSGIARKAAGGASRLVVPLSIGYSLFSAGQALTSKTMSREDKGGAVGGVAGGLAGGLAGAKLGALVGTAIFPGVGTALGGVLGGIAGSFAGDAMGGLLGKSIGRALTDKPPSQLQAAVQSQKAVAPAEKKPAPIEVKLDYKPNVVIHGDPTPQSIQKFGDMLRQHQQTLEAMLKRILSEQQRRAL